MSLFDASPNIDKRQGGPPTERLGAVIEREREYGELRDALEGTVIGGDAIPVVVGPEGSGKTTLVRRGLDDMETQADVRTITVDCGEAETLYRALVRAVNEFRSDTDALAETGQAFERVRDALHTEIESRSKRVVLVFDGINELDRYDALGTMAEQTGMGLVVIADHTETSNVSLPGTWPDQTVIRFHQYTTEELRDVLEEWATTSLSNWTLSPETIPLCATYGHEEDGNARFALRLLREASDIARNEHAKRIRGRHVQEAKEALERERLTSRLHDIDEHGHLILYAMLSLDANDELPTRTTEIYDEYVSLTGSSAGPSPDPLSKRRVQERLRTLTHADFVTYTQYNGGRVDGAYREYELAYDRESLRPLLATSNGEIHSSLSGLFG